jgi:hypothetical protein
MPAEGPFDFEIFNKELRNSGTQELRKECEKIEDESVFIGFAKPREAA